MINKITAVIGANYGDEGKGQTIYSLSSNGFRTLVVKHNGGAQAGHTVWASGRPNHGGRRFVFHQLGSCTFRGDDTLLADSFIVNPMLLRQEIEEFNAMKYGRVLTPNFGWKNGVDPMGMFRNTLGIGSNAIRIDSSCRLTTFLDIGFNMYQERARGTFRHGSCGMGINATVRRDQFAPLRASDALFGKPRFLKKMKRVVDYYSERDGRLGRILHTLGFIPCSRQQLNELIDRYWEDLVWMRRNAIITPHEQIPMVVCDRMYSQVLFEGGQGLALDEMSPDFPHVTRSRTGLDNPVRLMQEWGLDHKTLDVVYVTRPYLTRHGRGPLPDEVSRHLLPEEVKTDQTNVFNEWQEGLRFAPLDVGTMAIRIAADLRKVPMHMKSSVSLSVRCLDQFTAHVPHTINGEIDRAMPDGFRDTLSAALCAAARAVNEDRYLLIPGSKTNHVGPVEDLYGLWRSHPAYTRDGVGWDQYRKHGLMTIDPSSMNDFPFDNQKFLEYRAQLEHGSGRAAATTDATQEAAVY